MNPNSPAFDAIPNGVNGCSMLYTSDQRGVPRPQSDGEDCDIGAFELGFVPKLEISADDASPIPGQTVGITIVVANNELDLTNGLITVGLSAGFNFLGPITLEPVSAGLVGTALPPVASSLVISYTDRITVTFPATVSPELVSGTQLVGTAWFSSTEMITPMQAEVSLIVQNASPMQQMIAVLVSQHRNGHLSQLPMYSQTIAT